MFKFNFNQEAKEDAAKPENDALKQVEAKEHFLDESHLELIGYDVDLKSVAVGEDTCIHHIDGSVVSDLLKNDSKIGIVLKSNSDLVPGVYEGGLKIWEGSQDLLTYLKASTCKEDWDGKKVLELGCGAGLPGLFCFTNRASVCFQDYNPEVIERITMPNVLLNAPVQKAGETMPETKFLSGDWSLVEDLVKKSSAKSDKYDVILTSETIYNIQNQSKLLSALDFFLAPHGRVYLASKLHYFGVGGGLRQFEEDIRRENKWFFRTVYRTENESPREILIMTRKKELLEQ